MIAVILFHLFTFSVISAQSYYTPNELLETFTRNHVRSRAPDGTFIGREQALRILQPLLVKIAEDSGQGVVFFPKVSPVAPGVEKKVMLELNTELRRLWRENKRTGNDLKFEQGEYRQARLYFGQDRRRRPHITYAPILVTEQLPLVKEYERPQYLRSYSVPFLGRRGQPANLSYISFLQDELFGGRFKPRLHISSQPKGWLLEVAGRTANSSFSSVLKGDFLSLSGHRAYFARTFLALIRK